MINYLKPENIRPRSAASRLPIKALPITDKPIRLIGYLAALASINAKIVRSLDDYRKTLWIHNIPHEPKHYCFTQAWGQEDEHDGDVWLEVKKFQEPDLPKIPPKCSNWVKQETLRNTKDLPELYDSIIEEHTEEDSDTGEKFIVTNTLYLENYPDIQQSWDDYLEKDWMLWTERYNRYASVQKVYADLFHIHQEQQKLGEQYELVFCKGLLNWKTPSGHDAKRHIIVAKASLEFEPHLGKFTVKQAVDGDLVDIELDMLDVQDQPQNSRQLVEGGRNAIGANLWDRANIDAVLTSIANSLADSGQGEYHPDRIEPDHGVATTRPSVEFAPALILRKRSMRGLEQLLASMKEKIEAGEVIPNEFLDLCESLPEEDGEQITGDSIEHGGAADEEIFFPLRANDEQRRIIRTLDRQKGVLVQGPPGTGKSHTIANLICHLLATGKRVLVTAKTPRALQVLHDKLPSEIQPLCINLLGQGTEERESLEKSVTGILTRLDRQEESNNDYHIQCLSGQIQANRKDKAHADNKIMALRESETFTHNIANGQYSGTAAQIARDLRKEAEQYAWFTDTIRPDCSLPLSQDEIKCLCRDIVEIDQETEKNLSLFLPNIEKDLPEGKAIRVAFQEEAEAQKKAEEGKERLNSHEGKSLLLGGKEKIDLLSQSLSDFTAASDTIRQRPMPWIEKAIYDVLTDMDTPWKELLSLSVQHANDLHGLAAQVDSIDISIPQDMDRKKILHDAKMLKAHFESGGGAGAWIFKPKIVRQHGDLIGKVKVDGLDCRNTDSLDKLINFLVVELQLSYIWSLWSGKAERYDGPFPLQLAEIDELHEALESIINLYGKREDAKEKIQQINGLRDPRWENASSLNSLIEDCRVVLAQMAYFTINKKLVQIQNNLSDLAARSNSHPITARISKAFQERGTDPYCILLEEAAQLCKKAEDVRKKKKIIEKLAEIAPNLAGYLANYSESQTWAERLNQLDKAWAWAQGISWLNDFLNADLDSLERHSKRLDEDIRNGIANIAAMKAWKFCFARMNENHKRHLMSWQQSMKKLGKGTGKYAHTHRTNAQRHLNECRDAVPAWIMPLHRVYETVDPGAGIFDVIIVDEASQCGPEGLPLMYLGKRILVVGDDKQISPEAVGVNRQQIQQLMRNFLYDFSHADSFDVESSLFDHGRIRFSNRISLREHFRCMPEIIRFSNDLCYQTDPLIPLRQYPPDRLEPLKAVHVQDGCREGSGARVINRPEADALVDAIDECCKDIRYQGMTMGVIVLQGEAQAYHIEGLLLQRIGAEEMDRRRLICGNPYSFQGDERDIIFLSMVAAPNERIGTMTKEADQRRFNVAASRARDQMWLFYSATTNHLSEHCFRRRLLEHFINPMSPISQALGENAEELRERAFCANRVIEKAPAPFDSWFELDVALQIASRNYRVVPQYKFADKRIDLVVQGEKSQLAVECDGDFWHGADEYIADTERQRKLERCGWCFFRIRESRYYAGQEKSLESLWVLLDRMGIEPLSTETETEYEDNDNCSADDDDEPTVESHTTRRQEGKAEEPVEVKLDKFSGESRKIEPREAPIKSANTEPQPHQPKGILRGSPVLDKVGGASNTTPTMKSPSLFSSKYDYWESHALTDPRNGSAFHKVVDGLIEIIEAEGPMYCHRAYHLYSHACGIHKVGRTIRSIFNRAINRGVTIGKLLADQPNTPGGYLNCVVRASNAPDTKVRPCGNRILEEIPLSEIAALMDLIAEQLSINEEEKLFRDVLDRYEIKRLTSKASSILETSKKLMKSKLLDSSRPSCSQTYHIPQTAHGLDEDFTFKKPSGFILQGQNYTNITKWRDFYEKVCKLLADHNPSLFEQLPTRQEFVNRRGGATFAHRGEEMRAPIRITENIFVEANLSANAIRDNIRKLLRVFSIHDKEMVVFFRRE